MKNTSPAKKIAGKRRWYFRHNKVTLKTVLKAISFYPHPWHYAGNPKSCKIHVTRTNIKEVHAVPVNRIDSSIVKLTILDIYILSRWLRLGLINFSRFDRFKIFAFNIPLVKSAGVQDIDHHHFLCLEQNPEYPQHWHLHVRSRTFISSQPDTYLILCLPVKYQYQ